MKKVLAFIVALTLALSLCVPAVAAGRGTTSGQLTPFFADFDPQALSDILNGFDISGIFNDLGMGDLSGLFGDFSLSSILDSFDLGGILGDFDIGSILGDFDISSIIDMIMGLFGGSEGSDPTTTKAPTTTAPTTTGSGTTTSPSTQIPQTGDAGAAIAIGLLAVAAAAFICTRKKNAEEN